MATISSNIKASVVYNTETVEIRITEDKAKIILTRHFDKISKNKDWISSLGLFASLVLSLLTSKFHDIMGIPGAVIFAFFIMATIGSFIYLICVVVRAIKNKDSVEEIIKDMKGEKLS